MRIKFKLSLLSILACISLMSVGFSSWNLIADTEEEINGEIYVDSFETREYISDINIVKPFKYTMDGFAFNDGNEMMVEVPVDIIDCVEKLDPEIIKLKIVIEYNSSKIKEIDEDNLFDYMSVEGYCMSLNTDYYLKGEEGSDSNKFLYALYDIYDNETTITPRVFNTELKGNKFQIYFELPNTYSFMQKYFPYAFEDYKTGENLDSPLYYHDIFKISVSLIVVQ